MTAVVSHADDPVAVWTGVLPSAAGQSRSPAARAATKRWPLKRVLRWAFVLGLTALFAVESALLTPYLVTAAHALTTPNPLWLALALVAEGLSMGAFARVQRRMLSAAGQRVRLRQMVGLTYAANALSVTFPGGTALSSGYVFKRLRSWGASGPAAGFTVVASGVLSLVGFALLAVVVGLWAGANLLSALLTLGFAALAVGTALALRGRDVSSVLRRTVTTAVTRTNRILRRSPDAGLATAQRFADDLTAIHPRQRDWLVGVALATLNWTADLVCLFACCEAIGADHASVALVMVAYLAGMSASSVSLLPGGFGIVDVAMIFALTSGGVSTTSATAGVVLYRLISFLLVVAIGWLAWIGNWAVDRRRSTSALIKAATTAL